MFCTNPIPPNALAATETDCRDRGAFVDSDAPRQRCVRRQRREMAAHETLSTRDPFDNNQTRLTERERTIADRLDPPPNVQRVRDRGAPLGEQLRLDLLVLVRRRRLPRRPSRPRCATQRAAREDCPPRAATHSVDPRLARVSAFASPLAATTGGFRTTPSLLAVAVIRPSSAPEAGAPSSAPEAGAAGAGAVVARGDGGGTTVKSPSNARNSSSNVQSRSRPRRRLLSASYAASTSSELLPRRAWLTACAHHHHAEAGEQRARARSRFARGVGVTSGA